MFNLNTEVSFKGDHPPTWVNRSGEEVEEQPDTLISGCLWYYSNSFARYKLF